jgi:hypothetical protein
VAYLPEWFPGAGFQTLAREGREMTRKMRFEPIEVVKRCIVRVLAASVFQILTAKVQDNGTARQSIAATLLTESVNERDAAEASALVYAGEHHVRIISTFTFNNMRLKSWQRYGAFSWHALRNIYYPFLNALV